MNLRELIKINRALIKNDTVMEINRALLGGGDLGLLDRFSLLRTIARTILPEYRFKWPQLAWWGDRNFTRYLSRFGELDGNNVDRRWAVYQLMRLCALVKGDTAEVGVYEGAASWLICAANGHDRTHHIFDSFEGLSEPSPFDGTHWNKGALSCTEGIVARNLAEFQTKVKLYKGWVPERFPDVATLTFSFVHIDVDLYQPTKDSIEFFYPRVNPGGIIICDDYGFTSCPGATKACDDFLSDKTEAMIALPDGGGFLMKGVATASQFDLSGFLKE